MPFIVVAGITLSATDMTEQESELIGDETRSDSGKLRSAITAEKRRWSLTLLEMDEADLATLRAALALGTHVTASGDALGGSYTVRGYLRDMPYIRDLASFLRGARLELVEV